ncbi:putative NAD-dependent epimerase/dehydratase [Streptomyces sp. Tu6071]|nr:putative NAD-dependent epimerase/dehydratase [Streptomyces sp. Tu6071]
MADRVDAAQGLVDGVGVAHVGVDEPGGAGWRDGTAVGVDGGEQGVEDEGLVAPVREGGHEVTTDETGTAGDEYAHERGP